MKKFSFEVVFFSPPKHVAKNETNLFFFFFLSGNIARHRKVNELQKKVATGSKLPKDAEEEFQNHT